MLGRKSDFPGEGGQKVPACYTFKVKTARLNPTSWKGGSMNPCLNPTEPPCVGASVLCSTARKGSHPHKLCPVTRIAEF